MEEEAEEIESLDPPEEKEEPWCVVCREYSDYRRKWSTLPRANLDGGTYSENVESPHCVECENQMIYLSHCKLITGFFWVLGLLILGISLVCTLALFPLSWGSLIGFSLFLLLSFAIVRIPRKSRRCLAEWKVWKKEKGIKELTDLGLKKN
jgi:hypothetical protein